MIDGLLITHNVVGLVLVVVLVVGVFINIITSLRFAQILSTHEYSLHVRRVTYIGS